MAIAKKVILYGALSIFYLIAPVSFAEPSPVNKTTMQDVKQEMSEAAEVIKNYSAKQRDDAVKQAKVTLDKLDTQVEGMENQLDETAQKMSESAHQSARATLETLKKQRNDVARWYGSMQNSSGEAWQDVKTGFLKSYKALEITFANAQEEF